jgi:3',5'-cyclic AMP phosphodiesterase CpdA
MKVAHLSDLHFGRHDESVVDALVPELNRQNPDLVVISGDFVQTGTRAEFEIARSFVDRLEQPVFAVPGNHDIPEVNLLERLFNPYTRYRKYISAEVEPFLELGNVAFLGLKTTRRLSPDFNWSNGRLGRGQLDRLERRFAAASPSSMRVVVAHHPLLYPETGGLRQHRVAHADRALRAFASVGVRLVLSGHFHLSYVRIHDRPGTSKQGAPKGLREAATAPILVAQTSSTTSTRLRGDPNAYNLVRIDNGKIEIDVRQWRDGTWLTRERNEEPAAQPEQVRQAATAGEPGDVAGTPG